MVEEPDEERAAALFIALRRALEVGRFPEPERAALFPEPWRHAHDVSGPAGLLLLLGGGVGKRTADEIAEACLEIATWAAERRRPAARRSFACAAAVAAPLRADATLSAALAVSDDARYGSGEPLAEEWFHRAIMCARRADDWMTYAAAYIGVGHMHAAAGRHAIASRAFLKAERAAHRGKLTQLGSEAHTLRAGCDLVIARRNGRDPAHAHPARRERAARSA